MRQRQLSTRDLAGAAGEHEREELKVGSLEITPPGERAEPLLPEEETDRLSARWHDIQAGFSDERERLESQCDGGDDVSTEDLHVALAPYRSFFDRLLSA